MGLRDLLKNDNLIILITQKYNSHIQIFMIELKKSFIYTINDYFY